ncbi:MAG: HD domain-containing protein [Chloroflexi bacterium]|nr:HD domain-containing protein [Chloroflexota bacterium]
MGTIVQVAVLLLFPLPIAIVMIALAKAFSEVSLWLRNQTRSRRATIVNTSNIILANAAAGAGYHLLHGERYIWLHDPRALLALPALAALGILYQAVDTPVVAVAISLSSSEPPWAVLRSALKGMLLPMVSLLFVGIVFALLWHFSPFLSALIVVPVFLSARSFSSMARLRKETVEAVTKLAGAVHIRDIETGEHSERLVTYARRIAASLGLIPEEIDEIDLAARVHDLGKIGIGNEILLKQGPLCPEERLQMQKHPVIGAEILESYSAFQNSVGIVKHHHERWDGNGYPDGLKGNAIPIGSRIISVVDSYDAMISDRPYRRGLPIQVAVERLKAGIGTQFDPQVCAKFIELLIEDGDYVPVEPPHNLQIVGRPRANAG